MNIEKFLSILLVLHVIGGTVALLSGLGAMRTTKGAKNHRLFGKVYFYAMTTVFVTALATSIGHNKDFLLMVAFFSYYMTVRGYRILFLKKLHEGQKAAAIDWLIIGVSGIFIVTLIGWGVWALLQGSGMGVVGIVFGVIGSNLLYGDVRSFRIAPTEKMHWWYGHINAMGGSYISAATAFVVVNIRIGQWNWILWLIPSVIGSILISRSIKFYKQKFSAKAVA